jgi:hypothetical protein
MKVNLQTVKLGFFEPFSQSEERPLASDANPQPRITAPTRRLNRQADNVRGDYVETQSGPLIGSFDLAVYRPMVATSLNLFNTSKL